MNYPKPDILTIEATRAPRYTNVPQYAALNLATYSNVPAKKTAGLTGLGLNMDPKTVIMMAAMVGVIAVAGYMIFRKVKARKTAPSKKRA